MLEPSGRDQALLAFLALADIERQVRAPLLESTAFSAFLTLVIALQPDVERLAEASAAIAALANAKSDGNAAVDPHAIVRQFPREAPKLTLSAQRLAASYGSHAIVSALTDFQAALAAGKSETLAYIMADFAKPIDEVARAWREASAAGATLMRVIDRALDERAISGLGAASSALLALLDEVAAGGHSIVAEDGSLTLPRVRDGREFKRVPVSCPVTVVANGASQEAMLRDLSIAGLGLANVTGLAAGDQIKVQVSAMTLAGRIEWVHDGRAGVHLSTPIEADDPRLRFLSR